MSTRHLIAAAFLVGSACAAHADVLPATAAPAGTTTQSGYLSSWTAGNGADVVGSGVLGSGTSLIGGVSYGSATVAQALYEKASANQGGKVTVAQGIDGSYLVGMSNAKIAALLGNSVSVVGSGDNMTVTTGNSGGGSAGGSGSGGAGGTTGGSAGGAVGGSGGGSTGSGGGSTGGAGGGSSGGSTGGGSVGVPGSGALDPITGGDTAGGGDMGNDGPAANLPRAEVPEPSTIALMLAGMLGAVGMSRRRQR
jgi:hypothetical protein